MMPLRSIRAALFVGALVVVAAGAVHIERVSAGGCLEEPTVLRDLSGQYTQGAFIRDIPCMEGSNTIETIAEGAVVRVIAENDGWYKVETPEGHTGWTYGTFINIVDTPAPAVAQTSTKACPALSHGDLFKVANNSAVYLINADKKRLYFPHSDVFHTWYNDFSSVTEIPSRCVDLYPVPSSPPFGVNYRPGSRLIKTPLSSSVSVVEPGNARARIATAEIARALYGNDWASLVRDVPDIYWPNYVSVGDVITDVVPHDGMMVRGTASGSIFYVDGGALVDVDDLDSLSTQFVRTLSSDALDRLSPVRYRLIRRILFDDPARPGVETEQLAEEISHNTIRQVDMEADDNGFYIGGERTEYIEVASGTTVVINLTVRSTNVSDGGLKFLGCGGIDSVVMSGEQTVLNIVTVDDCRLRSTEPGTDMFRHAVFDIVVK